MRRGRARLAGLLLAILPVPVLAVTSCGSSDTQLSVRVTPAGGAQVKPGDPVEFVAHVENLGPGEADGVGVRVTMPSGTNATFSYQGTTSITGDGQVRTQATDPPVRASDPQWGVWTLAPPSVNDDGTPHHAYVEITFSVRGQGAPADYQFVGHANSDTGNGDAASDPLTVHLTQAANLTATVDSALGGASRGGVVSYRVTVLNQGSGPATGVGVLVTLPTPLSFLKTDQLRGNFSRTSTSNPGQGALFVYFSAFTIPGQGASGPGNLVITFEARVADQAYGGHYPVALQVTDADGLVLSVDSAAQVTIVGPSAPPPTPTPTPTASSTARSSASRTVSTPSPSP